MSVLWNTFFFSFNWPLCLISGSWWFFFSNHDRWKHNICVWECNFIAWTFTSKYKNPVISHFLKNIVSLIYLFLEDNWFTILWWFLLYINMNQPSDQISRSVVSDSLRPHESQHARRPCPSPTPGVHSDSRPSSQWCHHPSHPLLSPSPPAPNPSQHQSLFQWVNSSHEVAKVLEFQL